MAIFYQYALKCECGETITANLADGLNVARTPIYRDQIVAGTFHRVACPKCNRVAIAEKSFLYTDLKRQDFFLVKPRQDRHMWRVASEQLDSTTARLPQKLSPSAKRKLRVIFGMAELREKLIAEDLGLDDRAVELLKVLVTNEHPFLLRKSRLRLVLDGASDGQLRFIASYDLESTNFEVSIPETAARKLAASPRMDGWVIRANHATPITQLASDHWVNMWRWSPQPAALDELRNRAADVRAGKTIDINTPAFRNMLLFLPKGSVLPGWAKQDLQVLFDYAVKKKNSALQDRLFEIRFDKPLEDDWAYNDKPDDIDTLWKLFKTLPANNVEGNAAIRQIGLDQGGGGGWYEPNTHDIYIGSRALSDKEGFEDVVRHEIGHGVHEGRKAAIDAWLKAQFGWQMFRPTPAGVDSWVTAMNGWPVGTTPQQKVDVARYLSTALGPGSSWSPGPNPQVPAGHIWWRPDFGPRLAYVRTGANWYNQYQSWHRANGKAFFLNYWYQELVVVNESTLQLIAQMPSAYAAMSPLEFFAELYALYYDPDDPQSVVIPAAVKTWLRTNIGAPLAG